MLTPLKKQKPQRSRGSFAIIASRYNARYVDAMVAAAEKKLRDAGAKSRVVRVPGAFEIPAVAARLAARRRASALICLGVILRGQTSHAQQIADAVTRALAHVADTTCVARDSRGLAARKRRSSRRSLS